MSLVRYRVVAPQTDGQNDRIHIAKTRSQRYLPVQLSRAKNVKSFPNHKAHRAALISVSLTFIQTPVYTARL